MRPILSSGLSDTTSDADLSAAEVREGASLDDDTVLSSGADCAVSFREVLGPASRMFVGGFGSDSPSSSDAGASERVQQSTCARACDSGVRRAPKVRAGLEASACEALLAARAVGSGRPCSGGEQGPGGSSVNAAADNSSPRGSTELVSIELLVVNGAHGRPELPAAPSTHCLGHTFRRSSRAHAHGCSRTFARGWK
jgi:hypothetical protein